MATGETEPIAQRPPVPDPSTLTTEQLEKGLKAERDYVTGQIDVLRERLNGIDTATEVRLNVIGDMPGRVDEKIRCSEEVVTEKFLSTARLADERFKSVEKQFMERDTRADAITQLNKTALDAAFAAQKEAAAEQNKSNTLAISKSETATSETIAKLAELFKTTTDGLSDKIEDLKARQATFESTLVGIDQARTGGTAAITTQRELQASQRALLASVIGVLLFLMAAASFAFALAKP